MLSALHIENIAIIDQLDVEFESGFIVLTGETGAGKSIIIDSIQLLLGNKASKELVRSGEEYGIVSACFHSLSKEAIEILHTNDLDIDEDGNLTIYRKIGTDGRNNSRINGVNVTVSLLRQLGEHLINIHGQHDGVLLMDNRRHLSYLDEFGNISTDEYECAYKNVKEIKKELNDMQAVEATKAERKKQIEGYLEQLNACDLKLGEYDDLMCKRKNLILNAEIIEALHGASTALYDGEEPAAQLTKIALDLLQPHEKNIQNGQEIVRRLTQISTELDDLGAELGKLFSDYADNQMEPHEIESRLDILEAIRKEFGPSDEDVLKNHERFQKELDALDSSEERIQELEHQFVEARACLDRCAGALTKARKKAASEMESRLQNELKYLDMPKVRFVVRVADRLNDRGGLRYRNDGKDDVEFYLSSNAGEEPRPLSKIASGGELSRIMLSIKSVLNRGIDTVIYDEVDTGVSGATADKIGKKLQSGASGRQVFCITHLAQIAARADHHYKVEKFNVGDRVSSQINHLSMDARIREVARIMGGEVLTDNLLLTATEIIKNSKNND